jgi:pimeloyl-ACP methyl ester carboxylesterase
MSVEKTNIEVSVKPIALERCDDDDIRPEQIDALQDNRVAVARARAKIGGASVRFTHLVPSHQTDEVPIGIVNGYCGTESAYKQLAVELSLLGREVFYIRPPRTQTPFMAMRFDHLTDVLKIQSQATWGAMRAIRSYTDHEQFDLYCHSMGVPIGLKAALHKPEHVRSVVLAAGAGLNGENTFWGMAHKSVNVARKDVRSGRKGLTQHVHPAVILADTVHHVMRRPDRTVREGFTVARIDARPYVRELRKTAVNIGAILFEEDGYFPVEEVLTACSAPTPSGTLFDLVRITPGATHIYTQDHPAEHAHDVADLSRELVQRTGRLAITG